MRVVVDDWEAACHFYGETPALPRRFGDTARGWAEFDVGGAVPGVERVAADDSEGATLVGRFLGVSLAVDDIRAVYQRLRGRGVHFHGPPEKQPWGGALGHLDDPAGNTLALLG